MTPQATTTVDVSVNVTEAEVTRIATIFGIDPNGDDFNKRLQAIGTAALEEYMLAFAGTRSPSTIREMRELRLQLLYSHLGDLAPTDTQVAQLFELTPTQARNLIAGTRARYRSQLEETLSARAVKALKNSTYVEEDLARVRLSGSVASYLRDIISETEAPGLMKNRDASSTYDIQRSTAEELAKHLDFNVDELNGFQSPQS
jgi:hypothetical protein